MMLRRSGRILLPGNNYAAAVERVAQVGLLGVAELCIRYHTRWHTGLYQVLVSDASG